MKLYIDFSIALNYKSSEENTGTGSNMFQTLLKLHNNNAK